VPLDPLWCLWCKKLYLPQKYRVFIVLYYYFIIKYCYDCYDWVTIVTIVTIGLQGEGRWGLPGARRPLKKNKIIGKKNLFCDASFDYPQKYLLSVNLTE
jgi:hypothetical protein